MRDPVNLLTVDLEEWFVVEVLHDRVDRTAWPDLPSTVIDNSRRLLELFDQRQVRATWFALGWVAERYPGLIREIHKAGHEIACHSYGHRRVNTMTPEEFREDTVRAIETIQNAIGSPPKGYRAPSWSITNKIPWAFDILAELGFLYDSSIFPIKHDIYGIPGGPREVFRMRCADGRILYELPASTLRLLGQNIPVSGGGHLRHTPYWYSRQMIKKVNDAGMATMIYIHPWEIDPDPPRVEDLTMLQWLRTYGSTAVFAHKLDRLITDFRFLCIEDYLAQLAESTPPVQNPRA